MMMANLAIDIDHATMFLFVVVMTVVMTVVMVAGGQGGFHEG